MFFNPVNINIGEFKVNSSDHLGSISFGSTEKIGRNVKGKKNQGFGQQLADYTFQTCNNHFVLDKDHLDKSSFKIDK